MPAHAFSPLPSERHENAEAYETHLLQYLEEFQPVGIRESVQEEAASPAAQ